MDRGRNGEGGGMNAAKIPQEAIEAAWVALVGPDISLGCYADIKGAEQIESMLAAALPYLFPKPRKRSQKAKGRI